MRLQQFINEITGFEHIIEQAADMIKKNCKPFLKVWNKRYFLYRGGDFSTFFGKKDVRTNRKPLGTYKELHDILNDLFYKKFGWKPRSEAMFCTGSDEIATDYGTPYIVFPIGDFKYLWSPKIFDLFTEMANNSLIHTSNILAIRAGRGFINDAPIDDLIKMRDKAMKELVDTYISNDINRAIALGNEIMIGCKSYYYLRTNLLVNDETNFIDMLKG